MEVLNKKNKVDFKMLQGLINSGEIEKFRSHTGKSMYYVKFTRSGKENFKDVFFTSTPNCSEAMDIYLTV